MSSAMTAQEIATEMPHDSLGNRIPMEQLLSDKAPVLPELSPDLHITLPEMDVPAINPEALRLPPLPDRGLMQWGNGVVMGYNNRFSSFTSYGNMAGMALMQQWDNASLTVNLSASKAMVNAVGAVNGVGGNAVFTYRLGRNASVSAIAGMYHYGFLGPAPAANVAYYGGYFTFNTNNRKWGMDVGVRQVYDPMTGRMETVPIVMPYYNLGGTKLGFDFGGIIRSALWGAGEAVSKSHSAGNNRGPAIIAPPIDTSPKLKPIEMPKSAKSTSLY